MKTLKTKSSWTAQMLTAFLFLTFIACNEDGNEQDLIENKQLIEEEVIEDEISIAQGKLQKEFELILDEARYQVLVSTDNHEIFDILDNSSITGELISSRELDMNKNIEFVGRTTSNEEDIDTVNKNSEDFFVSIHIKELQKSTNKDLKVNLGTNLLNVIKKLKAQTIINIENNGERNTVNNNGFVAYGDGGVVPTKLRIRYKYSTNGTIFSSTTRYGFYNDYTFRTCEWPTTSSTRCKYTSFSVTQDVLTSFIPFSTYKCKKC